MAVHICRIYPPATRHRSLLSHNQLWLTTTSTSSRLCCPPRSTICELRKLVLLPVSRRCSCLSTMGYHSLIDDGASACLVRTSDYLDNPDLPSDIPSPT